jgi:hypothetical protein
MRMRRMIIAEGYSSMYSSSSSSQFSSPLMASSGGSSTSSVMAFYVKKRVKCDAMRIGEADILECWYMW